MSEESTTVEVADEIKAVMEDENFIPSSEDIECYGKHQIKPSEILPCPFCGSEHLYFGDWGTHGAYDKVSCGNECTDWVPVERWNSRPAEEALQKRIAELEAERDRLREALQIIASGHFSGTVELVNTEEMKTVWKSDVGLPMTVSEARDIARKALEGIGK